MEPVPRVVIIVFHIYGIACFVLTLFYTIAVIEADGCVRIKGSLSLSIAEVLKAHCPRVLLKY